MPEGIQRCPVEIRADCLANAAVRIERCLLCLVLERQIVVGIDRSRHRVCLAIVVAHQLRYVGIRIEHQLCHDVCLHIVEGGIVVAAAVIEHAVDAHLLEVLQTCLDVLKAWVWRDVVVEVAHIIPYIYMLGSAFPRFHRCLKLALFGGRTVHLGLQRQCQRTYKHAHIVGQTVCRRCSRGGIG